MSDFEANDKELKELWDGFFDSEKGSKAREAISKMAEVDVPKNLAFKIKNSNQESYFSVFYNYRISVVAAIFLLIFTSAYFFKQQIQSVQYSQDIPNEVSSETELLEDVFSEDEDKDIIDETLTTMEEIIWSV